MPGASVTLALGRWPAGGGELASGLNDGASGSLASCRTPAPEGNHPVGHALQSTTNPACSVRGYPTPIVFNAEREQTILDGQPHANLASMGVLQGVLDRLEAAEVDGGFQVRIKPIQVGGIEPDA